MLQEEQIQRYRVFGDRMFVPGVDAVESTDGTLYVRDGNGWTLLPLTDVVHATDVVVRGDEICVAVQDRWNGGAVRCSRDNGGNWQTHVTASWRSVSLFELGDGLYVSSHDTGVLRLDGKQAVFPLPGSKDGDVLVGQPTRCGPDVVFIAKHIKYGRRSAKVDVLGLFRASIDAAGAIAVKPIDVTGIPTDVFVHDGRCYALTNRTLDESHVEVAIFESADNRVWNKRTIFDSETMARSAELMQGYFYLGLGCELGHCTRAAGRLLRIAAP